MSKIPFEVKKKKEKKKKENLKKKYWNRNTGASRCLSKALRDIFALRSALQHPWTWEGAHQLCPPFSASSSSSLAEVSQPDRLGYSQDSGVGARTPCFKEQKRRPSGGRSLAHASEPLLEEWGQGCL